MNEGYRMFLVEKSAIPAAAILAEYSKMDGTYVDCYTKEVSGRISFPEFIFAFYTTWLFKLERFILTWVVIKPSTDAQARQLADGKIDKFAAWTVEKRNENELLLCDFMGRTRSWLMAVTAENNTRTRLYFGSAIVLTRNSKIGKLSLGFGFQALLGFHKIYSVLLLYFASLRIADRLSKIA